MALGVAGSSPVIHPIPPKFYGGVTCLVEDPFLEAYGSDAWALYIHVPFCAQKCTYCDFFTLTDPSGTHPLRAVWLDSCLKELDLWCQRIPAFHERPLGTIAFGGGTPSLLRPREFEVFLAGVFQRLTIHRELELSLEVQPGTLTGHDWNNLRRLGFNRISVGVQTLNDDVLIGTGRNHSARQARRCLEEAISAGLPVGADFIANLPGESMDSFLSGVETAVACGVNHLSTYDLSWHEGTEWERARRAGQMKPATEEERIEWQNAARHCVEAHGFVTYEVSNHARPGRASKHNCAYWEGVDYLGLGAGAHGFVRPHRFFNPPQAPAWYKALQSNRLYARPSDSTDPVVYLAENLHMALRKTSGINRGLFATRFGVDPLKVFVEGWSELHRAGYAEWNSIRVWLTPTGRMLLDGITEFLVSRGPSSV